MHLEIEGAPFHLLNSGFHGSGCVLFIVCSRPAFLRQIWENMTGLDRPAMAGLQRAITGPQRAACLSIRDSLMDCQGSWSHTEGQDDKGHVYFEKSVASFEVLFENGVGLFDVLFKNGLVIFGGL